MEPILELRNVSKAYPGVQALDDVTMTINRGEVVGIIGENGAGKSTLLNIIAGNVRPDAGEVLVRGKASEIRGIQDANRNGIGMLFQEQALLPNLTIAENLLMGAEGAALRGGWINWRKLNSAAAEELKILNLDFDPRAETGSLSFAQRQMVELTRVLALHKRYGLPPLALLDEPTSVLESSDIDKLFTQIGVVKELGSCVFISHRLDEVLAVSDRVYVMRDGQCVAERKADDTVSAELYELMVGRKYSVRKRPAETLAPSADSTPRLELEHLACRGTVNDVSLTIAPGEVLGLVGVIGSGREEVARAVAGLIPSSGAIRLDGRRFTASSVGAAVRQGISYVPAERKIEGIVNDLSISDNFYLGNAARFSPFGWIRPAAVARSLAGWFDKLRIKAHSADVVVGTLSGGNQQKVVLARVLNAEGLRVIVLDHPTRGLDVGAKAEVYKAIDEIRDRGIATLLLSDTLEETLILSDRIIAMRDGEISGQFDVLGPEQPTATEVVECMV